MRNRRQGAKAKPVALRVIEGNRSRRPLPPAIEVDTRPLMEEPPESMSEDAKAEWRRIAPTLIKMGMLTNLDQATFMVYCESWSMLIAAQQTFEDMRKQSPAFRGQVVAGKGKVARNPVIANFRQLAGLVVTLASEFGMSPSARARIGAMSAAGASITDETRAAYLTA